MGEKEYRVICTVGYHSLEFKKGKQYFLPFYEYIVIMREIQGMCMHAHTCTHAACWLLSSQTSILGLGNSPLYISW